MVKHMDYILLAKTSSRCEASLRFPVVFSATEYLTAVSSQRQHQITHLYDIYTAIRFTTST